MDDKGPPSTTTKETARPQGFARSRVCTSTSLAFYGLFLSWPTAGLPFYPSVSMSQYYGFTKFHKLPRYLFNTFFSTVDNPSSTGRVRTCWKHVGNNMKQPNLMNHNIVNIVTSSVILISGLHRAMCHRCHNMSRPAPLGSRQRPHIGKLVVKNSRTRQSLVWEQYGATKMLKISKDFYKDHYKETLRRTYLCISQLQHSQINVM